MTWVYYDSGTAGGWNCFDTNDSGTAGGWNCFDTNSTAATISYRLVWPSTTKQEEKMKLFEYVLVEKDEDGFVKGVLEDTQLVVAKYDYKARYAIGAKHAALFGDEEKNVGVYLRKWSRNG